MDWSRSSLLTSDEKRVEKVPGLGQHNDEKRRRREVQLGNLSGLIEKNSSAIGAVQGKNRTKEKYRKE